MISFKAFTLISFLLFFSPISNVQWSESYSRDEGFQNYFLNHDEENIYLLYQNMEYKLTSGSIKGIYLDKYDKNSLKLLKSTPINPLPQNLNEDYSYKYQGTFTLGDKFATIVSEYYKKRNPGNISYLKLFNNRGNQEGSDIKLLTHDSYREYFTAHTPDRSKLLVLAATKYEGGVYDFALINDKGEIEWKQGYTHTYKEFLKIESPIIESVAISEDGEKVAIAKIIYEGRRVKLAIFIYNTKTNEETAIITTVTNDKKKPVYDAILKFANNRLFVGGVVGDYQLASGYYFAEVSEATKSLIHVNHFGFEPSYFKVKKLGVRSNLEYTTADDFFVTDKGDLVLSLGGAFKLNGFESYQDFLIRFSPEGQRKWQYFLDKKQKYFGYYPRFIGSKKLHIGEEIVLLFNDHPDNYSSNRKKVQSSNLFGKSVLGIRKVNINTGNETLADYIPLEEHFLTSPNAQGYIGDDQIFFTTEGFKDHSSKLKVAKVRL